MIGRIIRKTNSNNFRRRSNWWRFLLIGFITYIIGLVVLILTANPNVFPSVVMLGNFLIPVVYVTFFYERRHMSNVRMVTTAASFFYGGFVGTFLAAILEPIFIYNLNFKTAIIVGVIEEFTKFVGVLFILRRKQHKLILEGIILGAAAGMGFAALESAGYAFSAFLRSRGSLSLTVYITLLRGILAPLGHGTWTAILTGVFLRERALGHFRFNSKVIGAYSLVVLLHGLWNGLPSIISIFTPSYVVALVGDIIVGFIGIYILFRLWKEGKKQHYQQL
ncbi:PrsW family intramembrane metalloprotease [Clostridium polyendosporum]|uniref:PrsW family intramembrane metalloprotease n=1 Tax=Clostridium polyendosporum TaxID=69208 RepID=A0A919RYS3_9CLOT|nr:PrsW family glutamic-type intramembrane protease [Clostridium polyendosporum]GIM28249.1 PrsW family intramembrane metalloprotease [Clostridium polyendosporum]